MRLPVRWNPGNKFCVVRVHYSADPEKDNPEWVEMAKQGISERSWQREYEISYDVFDGKPVFADFKEDHIRSFDYQPGTYVYVGWDFGYHHPAMVAAFINKDDQFCIRHEILGSDEGIKEFGLRVKRFLHAEFPGAKFLHACDPAGHQKSDKSEFTSVEVLNSIGIYPTSRASSIMEGIEIIRQRLLRRNDGQYGLLIHPDCKELIKAFKSGYRYQETKEGRAAKEEPLKDGWFDHLTDSLRYISVNFMEIAQTSSSPYQNPVENEISKDDGQPNDITRGGALEGLGDFGL